VIVTTVSEVLTTAETPITSLTLAFQPVASDCAESSPAIISSRISANVGPREGVALGVLDGVELGVLLGVRLGVLLGVLLGVDEGVLLGVFDASPGGLNTPTMDTERSRPSVAADIAPVAAVSVFTASATAMPLSAPVVVILFILKTHVPVVGLVPVFRAPACEASEPEAVAGSVTASNAPQVLSSPLETM